MPLDSIASHSGAKSGDYLVKIGGCDVFQLNHEDAKEVVRKAGNQLTLVVERGEKIVPSMNTAFPKPKEETVEKPKSYSQVLLLFVKRARGKEFSAQEVLERTGRLPGQKEQGFTTVSVIRYITLQHNDITIPR